MEKNNTVKFCDFVVFYSLLAIIFFTPLIFDFTLTNYNAFDLLKTGFFRVILSISLLVYVAKIFIQGKISYRGRGLIYLLALLLLAAFLISSFLSLGPEQSFYGSYQRQQGFYNLANYLLFFALFALNLNSFKQIRRLIAAALAAGALVCLYGLAQLFGLDPLPWKEGALATGRIFSSLGQPNFLGQYLVLLIPLSIYAYFFIARKFLTKFFFILLIIFELVCLFNTYSRAAWLAFFASAAFFIMVFLAVKGKKKVAISLAVILLAAASLFFTFQHYAPSRAGGVSQLSVVNRLKSLADPQSGSSRMRLYYWQGAIQEIKQAEFKRLFFGYGPDTLDEIFIKYYRPNWAIYEVIDSYADRAHNWPLDTILSFGLLGLAATLGFYSYFILKTARFIFKRGDGLREEIWLAAALSSSLVAYFVNNLFSFSLIAAYIYLFFILAMLWFIVGGREEKEWEIKLTRFSKILIWASLAIVVGLFIYLENINQVRADYYYMKVKKAERSADCQGILNNMEQALKMAPASAYYKEQYIFHGLNCFSAVNDSASQLALRDNLAEIIKELEPNQDRYSVALTLARANALFGFYIEPDYYSRAEEIFERLIDAYPYLLITYQDFGRMKMWRGDYLGALDVFNKAETILPDLNNPNLNQDHKNKIIDQLVSLYEKIGYSYGQLKNYREALNYYRQALDLNPRYLPLYKKIADIYYQQGKLSEAIALNKRGLMLNPDDYRWPLALSLLYGEKNNLSEANFYLEQVRALAPENEELGKYSGELNK